MLHHRLFALCSLVVFTTMASSLFAGAPADQPVPRGDPNSQLGHEQLLKKARCGGIDIYFEGDSITRRWGATDHAPPPTGDPSAKKK